MKKSGNYRSLASLALLRLSEGDLRALHATINEMSPGSFLELIRDIEDEITNSMALALDQAAEHALFTSGTAQVYREIDQLRRKQMRITVQTFVEKMVESLSEISKDRGAAIPRFDARRGLEAWIVRLLRTYSEHEIFHAVMRIRHKTAHQREPDWKLR